MRISKRKIVAAAIAFVLALCLFSCGKAEDAGADAAVKVHFVHVGQGDCAVIESPYGNVIIDTGTAANADALLAYLNRQDLTAFACMVLTHPHADHIGGAAAVLNAFPVQTVLMPDAESDLWGFAELLDTIRAKKVRALRGESGSAFTLGEIRFDVLGPVDTRAEKLNDRSIVLKMTYGSTSFLFMGDAESAEEASLLSHGEDVLSATVLKVGHHGANTSSTEAFVQAVSPQIAVISVGKDNDYGHPAHSVIRRLTDVGAVVLRTDEDGDIVLLTDGQTVCRQ